MGNCGSSTGAVWMKWQPSSILALRTPWTEQSGGPAVHGVRHDW